MTRTEAVTERRLQLDTGPVHVQADPTMVERIVENLLANAVKHTPGDARIGSGWSAPTRGPHRRRGRRAGARAGGPGPDLRPVRAGAEPQTRRGGVGLALVAKFAELHDGRAWVQERSGGGALPGPARVRAQARRMLLVLPEDPQATGTDSSPEESQA